MVKKTEAVKEKVVGALGSASGAVSILGSWQVCHSVCLGIVALLGVMGIVVSGMPLLFLTNLAKPFWIAALIILIITIILYLKKKCISKKIILFNSGLIIAGFPFAQSVIFWIIGGILAATAVALYIKDKVKK